ncbi:hypothetical protein LTS10_005190 [Elasticomyces elasticus]|nr:hypothetical protein LTS10_005190 [Elasticomyces elasticus]
MSTKAIVDAADAAASNQALLSAVLNAKDAAASPELVARVYEKLREIMSILEEDQKVPEVKGLLDVQPWEELAGEMMEMKTPEFEVARENVEIVSEMVIKTDKVDEKVSEVDVQVGLETDTSFEDELVHSADTLMQKKPKTMRDEVSKQLEAGKVAVKGLLCRTLGHVLILAALASSIVGIGSMYKAMEAAVSQDGIGLFEALLFCAFFFLCMVVAPWGLALVCAEKLGVDMGLSTKQ